MDSPLWGVLIAAAIVYMGIEAIVAGATDDETVWGLRLLRDSSSARDFGLALEPVIQFGGVHRLASVLAFNAGIVISYIFALALLVVAVKFLLRFSSAPRVP